MGRTLYDKLWDEHVVHTEDDGTAVLYIDRQLLHEVTSPQAFEGLDIAGRKLWRLSANLAVSDHNVPTTDRRDGIKDPISKLQVDTLDQNCDRLGITQFKMSDKRQGIVHVIGPEQGATLPGMTVVCGDSHTSTHGAFGALAHGIGTSEVEHVMATQTLLAKKAKNMLVRVDGTLGKGCSAKDIALAVIGRIGIAGGTGSTIEFAGSQMGGDPAEERKAPMIVSPVAAVRSQIGVTVASVKKRRINDISQQAAVRQTSKSQRDDRRTEGRTQADYPLEVDDAIENGGQARQQHTDIQPAFGERHRQRGDDIGKAAGLDQRNGFGSGVEDVHDLENPVRIPMNRSITISETAWACSPKQ